MLRHAAVIAIATACALGAAQGLLKVSAGQARADAPAPSAPVAASAIAAEVEKAVDGHYWAQADVDGRWIRMLVDTGASTVALTPRDAQRLGYSLADLRFDHPVATANGSTQAAAITLDRVSIGGAQVEHVAALVVRDGLGASLLGMTYLGRLSRFEATPTTLVLRP